MSASWQRLHNSLEDTIQTALDGNNARSSIKTKVLHGAVEKYMHTEFPTEYAAYKVKQEETIGSANTKFKVDLLGEDTKNRRVFIVLIKCPISSINKNIYNDMVSMWGEAIRIAINPQYTGYLVKTLFLYFNPTNSINFSETGKISNRNPATNVEQQKTAGLQQINGDFLYMPLYWDFNIHHSAKTKKDLRNIMTSQTAGNKIILDPRQKTQLDKSLGYIL